MSQEYGQALLHDSPIENAVDPHEPWARLFKKRSLYSEKRRKTLHMGEQSDIFNIHQAQFSFGREPSCTYVIGKDSELSMDNWSKISKVHFFLYKERVSNEEHIFIKDISRNGTYLNKELIGKNQVRMVKTKDVISVVDANLEVFTFCDLTPRKRVDVPNDVAEKFILGQELGSGAFGNVIKVFDRKANPYALKIIKHNSLASFDNEIISTNEIKIMREVNHVCIIKTIEMEKKLYYTTLVLEYMAGGDVLTAILTDPEKCLGEERSRCIFYQITKAVEYLHSIGITHRDIKPDNILLKDYEEYTLAKLTDFGLSKIIGDGGYMKTLIGTPSYTAPEVIRTDVTSYTSKIDIWSMGVTLFAMISGTLPFAEENGNVYGQIITGKFTFSPPEWDTVEKSGKVLIKRMLTVDPNNRIGLSSMLKSPWMKDNHVGIQNAKLIIEKNEERVPRIESNLKRIHIENDEDNLPPAKRARPEA